ncbi:MAG: hypothetical protein R3266_08205, partial [Gemmatimonadota bacterium]|nr:hypothetical protein [Gemmatimonadota bacterium]
MSRPLPGPGRSSAAALPRRRGRRPSGTGALDQGREGVKRIFREVDWSLSYVAFLVYFVVVITYQFGGAAAAILTAAGGLIIEPGQRRFPYWVAWFGLFLLWGAVSYTQSPFPSTAWSEGFIEYGKLWLICLVAANVLTNGPRLRFFLIFFLVLYMSHPLRGELFNTFIYGSTEWG